MCGIAGWIDYRENLQDKKNITDKMLETLKRRGPDASAAHYDNEAALLHSRLIVVDPKCGAQPMSETCGGETYTIVYNGELYNTDNLRMTLIEKGYAFKGHSDTEVLLKAYIEWGADCLSKLNGIYAFAIWHKISKSLFIARDRIGVKPIFFYKYDLGIIFASEIKTLLKNPIVSPHIDENGLKELILLGPGRIPGRGCIKGVEELLPAEYLYMDKDRFYKKEYWRLRATPHTDNLSDTVDRTRCLVEDAITRQLVSDVPLGCFLSGGLDSIIISMIAAKKYALENKQLKTYSLDYKDNDKYFIKNSFQPDTDNKYIDIMSKFINSEHKNIVLDENMVAYSLEQAQEARDLPGMGDIDSSLLVFCSIIKKESTVCLSGECADEIFGGYPWYHKQEILFKDTFPWSNSIDFRRSLFKGDYLNNGEEFVREQYNSTVNKTEYLDSDNALEKRMREMFMLNFYYFMQTLLDRKDRMSMFSGLEARVPFCDYRLVEYTYNMPWLYKALKGREKGILREAFSNLLPDEIVYRKKNPFPKTYNPRYLDYVSQKAQEILNDKSNIICELINIDTFNNLEEVYNKLDMPWYGQLMRLPQVYAYIIQLNAFFNRFNIKLV